ncbi:MAG: IS1182 family transposase [Lachnospiraceae bacterium]|nr:IS1182 family transposase [Lachnospiraceae bacterium]
MMNRRNGVQQKMHCITLESLMPGKHFLRDLDRLVNFDFVYEKVETMYSRTGRPSVDPVVIIKMMLLGYLYGIDSERKLEQETQVNIAFRWFLGIDLDESVPDHSTFSQLRRRKFGGTNLFEEIFDEVVRICMDRNLITGKLLLTDSTHVRANARNDLYETVTVSEEPSAYIKRLNQQAVQEGLLPEGYEEKTSAKQKDVKISKTDPESGYMHRPGKPNGFHYLSHQTCDAEHGLITDVLVTPGNVNDRSVHSQRIQYQIDKFGFKTKAVCADKGYDSSEIDADMLKRGIQTYIPRQRACTDTDRFQTSDYCYDEATDTYRCPAGCILKGSRYNPRTGGKEYCSSELDCRNCQLRAKCISERSKKKLILRGYNASAYETQRKKNGTPEYYAALRLRQIWCEGNFSHQKAHHNLGRTRKRGLGRATEHCLLSATAFNLKRMVKLALGKPGFTFFVLECGFERLIWLAVAPTLADIERLSTAPYGLLT